MGKYIGVVSAPLTTANFEPDLIIIYCNSAQLTHILLGVAWKEGREITCRLSSHAACVYSIVPAMQKVEEQVALPCRGDRNLAMAQDDELIFTIPVRKLEDLLLGFEHLAKYGYRLPMNPKFKPEPELSESYMKIAEMIGMDVSRP